MIENQETADTGNRVFLTEEQAIAMLPDGNEIHTFRVGPGVMIGCDCSRERILTMIREGQPELAGPAATGMGHGLFCCDLFIATKPEAK